LIFWCRFLDYWISLLEIGSDQGAFRVRSIYWDSRTSERLQGSFSAKAAEGEGKSAAKSDPLAWLTRGL
jgi:hypothetical protein